MRCRARSCKGVIEVIGVFNYKDYLLSQKEKCSCCGYTAETKTSVLEKYMKQVDTFEKITQMDLETWMASAGLREKEFRCDEIIAQRIVQIAMPGHEIIKVDVENRDKQYDLFARKSERTRAIEITQAINQTALESSIFLEHYNNILKLKKSKYKWEVSFNDTAKINKNLFKIENCLIKLEEDHLRNKLVGKIDSLSYQYAQSAITHELKKIGVSWFSGEASESEGGMIITPGLISGTNLDIKYILQVIHHHAFKKDDNRKKLELAYVNERHIVIPITSYEVGAAYYIQYMPIKQRLTLQAILDKLNVENFIPDIIDVIWLATCMHFTTDKKPGFFLVKVAREGAAFVIERISNDIMSYRNKEIFENI